MSKSITRVVFAVLISLGMIAAVPSVQSRLGSMLRKTDSSAAVSSLTVSKAKASTQGIMGGRAHTNLQFNNFGSDAPHGCHSSDPSSDY